MPVQSLHELMLEALRHRVMGPYAVTEMLRSILEQEEGAEKARFGFAEKEINARAMA